MTATIEPGSAQAWWLASRPQTLWAAISPVAVGGALAADDGVWDTVTFLVVLVAAVAIQIGVNFANDVADAATGADSEARIGPTRAVAAGLLTPKQVWQGIGVVFGLAIACGIYLFVEAGPWILVIGAASLLAALGYTNGPVPYGYRGLGEVFVFVFFGLVATAGTRFVFDGSTTAGAWVGGVSMGLLATAILVANNYRDIETDAAAGKRTLAVRIGRPATRAVFAGCVVGGVVVCPLGIISGAMPDGAALALVALPLAVAPVRTLWSTTAGPPLIEVLKGSARLQAVVAALLAVGIAGLG